MTPNKTRKASKRKSNRMLMLAIGIIAIVIIGIGAYAVLGQNIQNTNPSPTPTPTPTASPTPNQNLTSTRVLLQTTAGNITIELRDDKPITSGNFKNLVEQGKYDGTIFHRVIAGFMIQGGAVNENIPTIKDEIGSNNRNVAYTIAMAKTSQPNSATSQFFINVADNGNNVIDNAGTKFDSVYTVFGTVISGQAVVDIIANAPVTYSEYGERSQPINPITLIKATVIS